MALSAFLKELGICNRFTMSVMCAPAAFVCFVCSLIRGLSKNLTDIGSLFAKFFFGFEALAAAWASFFEIGVGNVYW